MSPFIVACESCRTLWNEEWETLATSILTPIANEFPMATSAAGWERRVVNLPLKEWIARFVDDPKLKDWWDGARVAVEDAVRLAVEAEAAKTQAKGPLNSDANADSRTRNRRMKNPRKAATCPPAEEAAGLAEKARNAFLTHRFFACFLGTEHEGLMTQILAARSARAWSVRVAQTLELDQPDRLEGVWTSFGMWLVRSLAAARRLPLSPTPDSGAAGPARAMQPLWWDRDSSLETFVRVVGLGQRDAEDFWPGGFISSPVGHLLRSEGVAVRIHAAVQVTEPCGCGHRHVSLRGHGCGRQCCKNLPPWLERRDWLLSYDAVDNLYETLRWVCLNEKCRRISASAPVESCKTCGHQLRLGLAYDADSRRKVRWICSECGRPSKLAPQATCEANRADPHVMRPRFVYAAGSAQAARVLPAPNPGPTVQPEALRRVLLFCSNERDCLVKKVQAAKSRRRRGDRLSKPAKSRQRDSDSLSKSGLGALRRLLVLASLSGGPIPDFFDDLSRLQNDWREVFLVNLIGSVQRDKEIARIKEALSAVCQRLGVAPHPRYATITAGYYGVLKHHIKSAWENYQ